LAVRQSIGEGWIVQRLLSCVVFISALAGAAQAATNTPPVAGTLSPSLDRRIELLIRSQFSVRPDYDMTLGSRTASDTVGYDNLPVTFSHKGKQTTVDFLISKDGSTLERVEKFSTSNNAAMAIDVEKRPVRGDAMAKVEIVNFDDLQCPYCGMLNNEILPQTINHYKGLVKIVYKDYPLPGHPWALRAAIDANCLASQSDAAYWAYVDYVHSHGQDISGATPNPARSFTDLDNIAGTIGKQSKLDETQLAMCLKKQDDAAVNASLKLGSSLKVEATPQVFVDGERLPGGAQPADQLWPAIDRALKAQGIQPPPETPNPVVPAGNAAHEP
jgi:protein-disulfide isomerase